MKHLIFEGIDCAGKTTTIKRLSETLAQRGISSHCIDEISDSPIFEVQQNIFKQDPFFRLHKSFKTSLFETLLLSADAVYRHEKMLAESKKDQINSVYLYDRDVPSVLAYQSLILKEDYPQETQKIVENLSNILFHEQNQFDGIVFIDIPLKTVLERTQERENRRLTLEQINFLKKVRDSYHIYLDKVHVPVLKLSGLDDIEQNVGKIIQTFSLENEGKEKRNVVKKNQTHPTRYFDGHTI